MTYEEAIEILQEERDYAQFPKYVREAVEIATSAIKKRIPASPIIWHGTQTPDSPIPPDDWGYECPCCGNQEIDYPDHHCECGQALDWSDVE